MPIVAKSAREVKRFRRPRVVMICLVGGAHRPGSPWLDECPLTHAAQRSERSRKGAQTRQERRGESVAAPGVPEHARPMLRRAARAAGGLPDGADEGQQRDQRAGGPRARRRPGTLGMSSPVKCPADVA